MKRLLLILLPLFLIVGCSKKFVHTETFKGGNIKSLTSHKETRNRIEKVKYVEYHRNGQKKNEGTYKDGRKISVKEWNKDGSVK
jgi:antitoxin component YwqK of YwqJK toxin-antitoxin module